MSKSSNMLRTRRRDNNVKPNRRDTRLTRLDRKSSRGMIYENEELRLKTININAEIERGQSDIKKLKRENELLKKEIWCLRDEYDKLDKLLKDKKIDFSSSSTTCSSSDSESCSSCTEDSEEVETSQNLENVQKTNLKNIHAEFDHLSVVPEENSTENSDKTSNRASLPNDQWNFEIKPDQSYPIYENIHKSHTLPIQEKMPSNFFSPIKISKSFDDSSYMNTNHNDNNTLYPGQFYSNNSFGGHHNQNYTSEKIVNTNASSFYQNMVLVPKSCMGNGNGGVAPCLDKSSTDLIVKMDNQNFVNTNHVNNNRQQTAYSDTPTRSTFSNGGNLEELLNDIETISQDILKISNLQRPPGPPNYTNGHDFISQIQREDMSYLQNQPVDNLENHPHPNQENGNQKPYKSEINVVLMPNPMPLIGFDKYKNIHRSFDSINSKPIEDLSASQQDLCIIPPNEAAMETIVPPPMFVPPVFVEKPPLNGDQQPSKQAPEIVPESNPFFFGNLKDNYVNGDYFNMRYNPDMYCQQSNGDNKKETVNSSTTTATKKDQQGSKANLLDLTSSDHISSENEENLKFKPIPEEKPTNVDQTPPQPPKKDTVKSPKLSIRRKVSIHFKGKKDKTKKFSLDSSEPPKKSSTQDKKNSLFDIKFSSSDGSPNKAKSLHQKTPSIESRKSTTETSNVEPKTPTSSDSKTSNSDKKNSIVITDPKGNERKVDTISDKKQRKSVSVSPDRNRHVHVKDEGGNKKHKKHKRSERQRGRRSTANSLDPRNIRERSFSVCTDRSNMLEHRLGLGLGSGFLYDDYSDRERTNSLSSCETMNTHRKMSTLSNVPLSGKVPWCGCWGNGCL